MARDPRPWSCAGCGALAIHVGAGRLPERCDPCKAERKLVLQRERRGGTRVPNPGGALKVLDPEPSKAGEKPPPLTTALPAGPKSMRGRAPLPLDGMPDPTEDLAAARLWIMSNVFGVELYSWQKDVLREIGGITRPRRGYVQVGRKQGKSLLVAALVLTELVLIPESAIYGVADTERNLNSVLVREMRTLIGRSYETRGAFIVTARGIEYPFNSSFFEVRPGNYRATQGINPTLAVMDEVHLQKTDEVWNGMQMAGAARPGFMLIGITTPGYDLTSMAHDLYLTAKAGEPTLWARIFEPANTNCALDDREAWVQANPRLLDDPGFLDALAFDHASMPEHEFRRFRLGIWTATESAWLPYGAWDARAVAGKALTPLTLDPTRDLWLGFDGSYSGDSTALVAAQGGHLSIAGVWENPGRKGWRVPRAEVEATIESWMGASRRVKIAADPPYWGREISEWEARWPGRVIEFPTHIRARMAPACTAFYAAVMDGTLTHDGDKRLARHVSNAIVRTSPQGDYITKPDPTSPAKIDLAVAAVVAYSMAMQAQRVRHPAYVG